MNSQTHLDSKPLKLNSNLNKPTITISNSNDRNSNENLSSKNREENESRSNTNSNENDNSNKESNSLSIQNSQQDQQDQHKQDDPELFKPRKIESNSINKESWLLRLFESKLFNMSYAIIYLHQSKEIGILNYIGNKMFQFDNIEVNFYLPQLIVLYINHNEIVESIRPYLLKRCKDDVKFTHNLLWLLNSFCFNPKSCHPLIKKKCNGLKLKSIILSEEFYYTKENNFNSLNSYTSQSNQSNQSRSSSLNTSNLNINNISELNCSKLLEVEKLNSNQFLTVSVKKAHHRSYSETTQIQISKLQNAQHSSNQSLNNILNQHLNHQIGDLNSGKAFDNNCLCLNTKNAVCDELKGEKFKCKCGAPRLQAQNEFVKCLINIGNNLQNLIPSKELRQQRLIADLQLLNFNLPARVYSPLHDHINHLVLRIPPQDSVLLNSKDKAPFLIYLEICKLDGDINSTVLPNKTHSLRLTRSEENLLNYQQINSRSTNCLLNVNSSCKLDSLDYSVQREITINASDIRKRLTNSIKLNNDNLDQANCDDPSSFVLKEPWNSKVKRIRESSPFGHLPNWGLVGMIVKCDDLRQEMMTYQLLLTFKKIWQSEKVPLYVRPYKIMVFSQDAGVIEPVLSTISLHQIKKSTNGSLLDYFIKEFGPVTSEGK